MLNRYSAGGEGNPLKPVSSIVDKSFLLRPRSDPVGSRSRHYCRQISSHLRIHEFVYFHLPCHLVYPNDMSVAILFIYFLNVPRAATSPPIIATTAIS